MIFPKKCLGLPPFLGYICLPKVVGAHLLLSALLSFRSPSFLSGVPESYPIRNKHSFRVYSVSYKRGYCIESQGTFFKGAVK